jgi:hypothetical protein
MRTVVSIKYTFAEGNRCTNVQCVRPEGSKSTSRFPGHITTIAEAQRYVDYLEEMKWLNTN